MSGIDISTAESQLALWISAETAVASGQRFQHEGRVLDRANLREIGERIDYWNTWCKRLTRGASRSGHLTRVDIGR